MKTILFAILTLFATIARAQQQYYYDDIRSTSTLGDRMKDYVTNKVKTITAVGIDPDGSRSRDYNELQDVDIANYTLKIATRNGQQVNRQRFQFDGQYHLLTQVDSSAEVTTLTSYTYDATGNITRVKTTTQYSDSLNVLNEGIDETWQYNASGQLQKMLRIVNGKDSSEYRFTLDEKGNVGTEQLFRGGFGQDPVYYYYDDNHNLTDIVRYDKKVKRLLPSVMFVYDENNRVIQRTTVLATIRTGHFTTVTPDYLIWRYIYNAQGLKTKEALFSKAKDLKGTISYSYVFQ